MEVIIEEAEEEEKKEGSNSKRRKDNEGNIHSSKDKKEPENQYSHQEIEINEEDQEWPGKNTYLPMANSSKKSLQLKKH